MAKTPSKTTRSKSSPTGVKVASQPNKKTAKAPIEAAVTKTENLVSSAETAESGKPQKPLVKHATSIARFVLYSSIPEVLLMISLVMARYLQNSDFSYPSEIVVPSVLLGLLATAFFYLFKKMLRRPLPAHIATTGLMYGLYGYTYTYPLLDHVADWLTPDHTTPFTASLIGFGVLFAAFVSLGGLVDLIVQRVQFLRQLQLHKILVFVLCFIFVVQLGKVGQRVWTIRHQLGYHHAAQFVPAKPTAKTTTPTGAKPNIYYLLFDRYGNAQTLDQIYHYDNTPTLDFLRDQGFVTRDQAYANYPFTMQSVSSTMAMNYFPELNQKFAHDGGNFQSAFPYRDVLEQPPIAAALQQNGYTYNQLASWWDFTRVGIKADNQPTKAFGLHIFGMTFWMSDLQRDIINKSILSPWLRKGVTVGHTSLIKYENDVSPRDNFEQQMSSLQAIAAQHDPAKPQFTFAHVLVPHDPYIFSADGSNPDYTGDRDDAGADETVKYTNQLAYLNRRLQQVVGDIRTRDPNAIIVLQADEGPYPKQFRGTLTPTHYYDPINLPQEQMQQKFGVLAAYYLPNVEATTASSELTSSVNTFRVILNTYLGYSLPLLPDCQFAVGNKFQLYNYQLVTDKLKGEPAPAECKALQ